MSVFAQPFSSVKLQLLRWIFPSASAATYETLEILMDMEQLSFLLASYEDMRTGQVVSAQDAFSDL